MRLTDRLKAAWSGFRADAVSDLRSPTAWLASWVGGGRVRAGVAVSPQTSLGLSTYYACLRAIAEDCAKLPLQVLERQTRGRTVVREHPLWEVLHDEFNQDMTAMTGREVMTHHALGWGNAYGLIVRDRSFATEGDGQPVGIYPIEPWRVRPDRDTQTGRLVYHVVGQAVPQVVPAEDMIHVKGLGSSGLGGYSVCALAAESLGLSLAAQDYGASFFGNGATPSGVLRHPEKLSPEAQKHLKESWMARHGQGQSQGIAVLEEGMEFAAITIPPEQAQFLQTRQFQVIEVCRWFRMPPHKLQDLTNSHYANIEQQNAEYVVDTLLPWLVRWESELRRKLFRGTPYYAKHEVRGLLRGDSAARAEYYRALSQIGAYSINEIRELEDFNPVEGGDEHYMQIQYAPISRIADGTARRPRQPRQAGGAGNAGEEASSRTNGHRTLVEEADYAC